MKLENLVTPAGSEQEVVSLPLVTTFTTRPLAPSSLKVHPEGHICWTRSGSPGVRAYRVRWRAVEEGSRAEEAVVEVPEEEGTPCQLQLQELVPGVVYKVNVFALVEEEGKEGRVSVWEEGVVESRALHEKVAN